VIQAVALAEFDGHSVTNAYGHLPLADLDPARPDVREGSGNDYWDHADYIVDEANARGLYIGMLPTWGVIGTTKSKMAGRSSIKPMRPFTENGLAGVTGTRASSGSWAAIGH